MNNNENLKEKEEKLINGDVEEIKKDINKILLKPDNYFSNINIYIINNSNKKFNFKFIKFYLFFLLKLNS